MRTPLIPLILCTISHKVQQEFHIFLQRDALSESVMKEELMKKGLIIEVKKEREGQKIGRGEINSSS